MSRTLCRAAASLAAGFALAALAAGCGGRNASTSGQLQVVAAENFWGSIAAQLAGSRATVRSIIVNPSTDPHSYEPTASDARTMAGATLAIVNGLGYDTWASRLLAANPVGGRTVLDVGDLLGLEDGDNPHQWYSPASVRAVVGAITADLTKLDPADAAYFAGRRRTFENVSLARYDAVRARIRQQFAGTRIGYSESIFEPLAQDLDLVLATPAGFAKAIAEGTEVSATDTAQLDHALSTHAVAVWIFNSQNVTPDVQRANALARAAHIPIVTVTETLSPASDSYQQWQVAQLERLDAALRRAATHG